MSSLVVQTVSLILPFRALRPARGRAADVVAPPYDVLSTDEARVLAADRPWSFLHVSKPEIDLSADTDPYAEAVYAKGKENLLRMIGEGVLRRDGTAMYYAYRLRMGDHVQTGLVAAASVAAYDAGRIRRHELTRPDKEDDRVRQIEAVGGHTGPVLLAYPPASHVDTLLAEATSAAADDIAIGPGGVEHALWSIGSGGLQQRLSDAFEAMPALYIADGHHRSAAASRVARHRREFGSSPDHPSQRFLVVAFPHHQMKILAYNRVVRDLGPHGPEAFLHALEERFEVQEEAQAVTPRKAAQFGLRLGPRWYRLTLKAPWTQAGDPVARLDVSLLAAHVLEPLLGIADPRRDKRIDFVGGIRGVAELDRRVDSGEWAAAFSMFPTQMTDLMAVADQGMIMPPKSTWFEPKLADGMASLMLDG